MPNERVELFLKIYGSFDFDDLNNLINKDLSEEDMEYLVNYIEDNMDYRNPGRDCLYHLAKNMSNLKNLNNLVKKLIESEGIWTPYLLSYSLIDGRPFPEYLNLYRKNKYQIYSLITSKSKYIESLGGFDPRSYDEKTRLMARVRIKAYMNDLDHLTVNRLQMYIDSLLMSRDRYDISHLLISLFNLRDIHPRISKFLNDLIVEEFKRPDRRRVYSSSFLKSIYSYMNSDTRIKFHRYVEELFENSILDIKEFNRYDKAYLESSVI